MRPLCFHRHLRGRSGEERAADTPSNFCESRSPNINSCFHHFPNPFSLIPGPSAQRDPGPQTKCLSLIHLSSLSLSLFFNLMRGCGECCQCDNNYRNSPAAIGPGSQNMHTHNCEVMEKAKKRRATASRPSPRR